MCHLCCAHLLMLCYAMLTAFVRERERGQQTESRSCLVCCLCFAFLLLYGYGTSTRTYLLTLPALPDSNKRTNEFPTFPPPPRPPIHTHQVPLLCYLYARCPHPTPPSPTHSMGGCSYVCCYLVIHVPPCSSPGRQKATRHDGQEERELFPLPPSSPPSPPHTQLTSPGFLSA